MQSPANGNLISQGRTVAPAEDPSARNGKAAAGLLSLMKETVILICAALYSWYLWLTGKRSPKVVIYYHGVPARWSERFRRQMSFLARHCSVIKPSEIHGALPVNRPTVAITFDDGFVSVEETAVPILQELNLVAGLFIPSGNLDGHPRWRMPEDSPDRSERVMGPAQLKKLDSQGFEIGSHSLSHVELASLGDEQLQIELTRSKQVLEETLGHEVRAISYPHGSCDERVRRTAEQSGYRFGFTIEPEPVDACCPSLLIGRVAVSPEDSLFKFRLKATGAYQVHKRLMSLKRLAAASLRRIRARR
jgi:peptidoglycan/xylan/chitin deacetylase (PgdA/CDA1 family)